MSASRSAVVAFGMADQMDGGGADLARIVRRDRGRHADRDAGGAVGQQVREAAGQHDRLVLLAVIGRAEIDRVLVDAGEQRLRDLGQPRLGVAHGRGVIAVDIAEIALALDQRVARGEILRQAHQRVVDRDVAVRVELADHVADHAGAFLEAGGGIEPQLVHRVDQPPVHRLQPVAHIRQRARHDGGQRIGQIALGQRVRQAGVLDMAGIIRHWVRICQGGDAVVKHCRAAGNGRCCWPKASRARKCPVSRSPSAQSAGEPALVSSSRNAGNASSRSRHAPAAASVTARPLRGDT